MSDAWNIKKDKTVSKTPIYAEGDVVEICDGSAVHGYKAKVLWIQDDEKMIVDLEKFGLYPVTKKEIKPYNVEDACEATEIPKANED